MEWLAAASITPIAALRVPGSVGNSLGTACVPPTTNWKPEVRACVRVSALRTFRSDTSSEAGARIQQEVT